MIKIRNIANLVYKLIPVNTFLGKKLHILCLHGVAPKSFPGNNRHMKTSDFEELLKYLKTRFDVVNLKEIDSLSKQSKTKKPSVLITFDDGYYNNFEFAAPLLTKYNLPAVFFVLTKPETDQNFTQYADVVDLVNLEQSEKLNFDGEVFEKLNGNYLNQSGENLNTFFKKNIEKRERWKNQLLERFKILNSSYFKNYLQLMDSKQWVQINSSPLFTIASHSHTHYNLDLLSKEDLHFELKHSKEMLEHALKMSVKAIAYPDGAYNQLVKDESRRLGYNQLFAVSYKMTNDKDDKTIYNRFSYSNSTTVGSNILRMMLGK